MLDIKFIRDHTDLVKTGAANKRIAADVDRLCIVDTIQRDLKTELDELRRQSNKSGSELARYRDPQCDFWAKAITSGMTEADINRKAAALQVALKEIKTKIKALEAKYKDAIEYFDQLMLTIPQPPAADVPIGKDDTENIEIRTHGQIPQFDFELKDHVELCNHLDILDIERGVKLAGSRNYVLKGDGAMLHQAVLRLALDTMIRSGFTPLTIPVLVLDKMMEGTGYYPGGEEQAYRCERDAMSLVGTAEVSLTAYHSDEILTEAELPKKYVAMSPCFRREAGAAGKDTYGLYRIHLFEKVEQVIICRNDEAESIQFHQEILANAEAVLQALELPYRVVNVCTGDLGMGQVQKFDIETWMPSRNSYSETHSASRFYEYQARRLNLRYRDDSENKKVRYCHTLNNTVIASPRILIPLLELHQNADGSVNIPKSLRPYMNNQEVITPPKVNA